MFVAEIVQGLNDGQRLFSDRIYSNLVALRQGHAVAAYASLILVGFLYGFLHAIGPGHGKVIVSSYVLANENSLKRGLVIVALSSLLQAVTAIVLVLGFYYLLDATRSGAEHVAGYLEAGSFALIGGVGIVLAAQGLRGFARVMGFPRHRPHSHANHDVHEEGACGCGHAHIPSPQEIDAAKPWGSLGAMIVSIGIRPCTGALLLLFFACRTQLTLAGVLATFAMAAGTALATGALAFLAMKSRNVALRLFDASEKRLALAQAGLRLVGGVVIMAMALLFWVAHAGAEKSLETSPHPLYKSLK